MEALAGRSVVLGVSGGIAAYKGCALVSLLKKEGASVRVIMTRGACRFVQPLSFETLSGHRVHVDAFEDPQEGEVGHIALAKAAELLLVAPATAHCLAKFACGLADDMLTAVFLATRAPVLLAPAMNTAMWEAPSTRRNLEVLLSRGCRTVGPEGGQLACGDTGAGRMSEPEAIVAACAGLFGRGKDLAGLSVLVTAGPTREAIDPVRFLSNRSSGKMGYALAQAAADRGARVTLVSGPVSLPPPAGVELVRVVTTEELYQAVLPLADSQDLLIQAAAPADFRPAAPSAAKIGKQGVEGLTLELVQTRDAARELGRGKKPGQTFVGFAAETGGGDENARKKLRDKNLDLIALNDVTAPGAGFDVDTNVLTLITAGGSAALPLMSKREAADALLDRVLALRRGTR